MSLLLTAFEIEIDRKPDFVAAFRAMRVDHTELHRRLGSLLEELAGPDVATNEKQLRLRLRRAVRDARAAWTGKSQYGWSTTLRQVDLLLMGGDSEDAAAIAVFDSGELFRHSGAAAAAGFRFTDPVCPAAEHSPVADQTT